MHGTLRLDGRNMKVIGCMILVLFSSNVVIQILNPSFTGRDRDLNMLPQTVPPHVVSVQGRG